jgi:phosphinothricin acetyltransferase
MEHSSMNIIIRAMKADDWNAVQHIYMEGIATGNATFQTSAPAWGDWDKGHLSTCRLVAEKDGEIAGWAALSPVSSRCVYRGVAEVSIYVGDKHRGAGVGSALMRDLIMTSEKEGFWTLQSGVFPENQRSLALQRKCGFREVGCRKRLGQLNGVWRDVLLLERRSLKL